MKKRFIKAATSLMLAALMVIQPLGGSLSALAAEMDVEEAVVTDATAEQEEIIDQDNQMYEVESWDEISETDSTEEISEDASEEGITEDASEDALEDTSEETAEDLTDVPEVSMASEYVLSEQQIESKKELKDELSNICVSGEGVIYEAKQAVFLADTVEEAQEVADAYGASLYSYEYGVAVLEFAEMGDAVKAFAAAADENSNAPAVWPNYFCYATDMVSERVEDGVEIIEEEDAQETSGETVLVGDENISLEDYEVSANAYNDPALQYNSSNYQWQHARVGSNYAWDAGYTGKGVVVAVLDTGVNAKSGELAVSKRVGVSSDGTSVVADGQGHGTHVAGIIGAQNNNSVDGSGIAPGVTIIGIKVLNDKGSGNDSTTMAGINKAIELGNVDLINMSLGGIGKNGEVQTVVTNAKKAGIAVFASAGNEGRKDPAYPAAYKDVIAVAAMDTNNKKASFSNSGSYVDIAAPGVDIWSTNRTGGAMVCMSGTSQACPVAVGEAAVILSSGHKDIVGKDGAKKVEALEKVMKSGTVSAGSGCGKGYVSLTKVFKLKTIMDKPNAPVITTTINATKTSVSVSIAPVSGATVYYSTNGKTPTYKNGVFTDATKYTSSFSLSASNKYVIKAIAVNGCGLVSPVKSVTVNLKPLVTSVILTGPNIFVAGKGTQITASISPAYATNKKLEWIVSDADKAKGVAVSSSGKVTTKSTTPKESYTITAKTKDGSNKAATFTFTVIGAMKIKSVKFNKSSVELVRTTASPTLSLFSNMTVATVSEGGSLTAKDFYWTSSNAAIVSVGSTNGTVTALQPGTATITALANDGSGKKATCKVVVKQQATGITVTAPGKTVAAGKTMKLTADVTGPYKVTNTKVTWEVKPAVEGVTVSNGVVKTTAAAAGKSANIYATTADGSAKFAYAIISVKAGAISGIKFNDKPVTLFRVSGDYKAKKSQTVTATITGTEGSNLGAYTVTSSNPSIVSATASGAAGTVSIVLTSQSVTGTSVITIASTDGSNKKATLKVTVNNPASKVLIAPDAGRDDWCGIGKTISLKPNFVTEYGKIATPKLEWSITLKEVLSSDTYEFRNATSSEIETAKKYISISSSGKITSKKGLTPGTGFTVTAKATDGSNVQGTYEIFYDGAFTQIDLYDGYGLKLSGTYLLKFSDAVKKAGKNQIAYAYIGCEGPSYVLGTVVTSSNPAVAEVMQSGDEISILVLQRGNVTITVKTTDGTNKSAKFSLLVY